MLSNPRLTKRSSPREMSRLENTRFVYSSRAERSILMQKLLKKRIKRKVVASDRKRVTILVKMPTLETESSNEDLRIESPNIIPSLSRARKRRRIIFKSDIERVYTSKPFIFSRLSRSTTRCI